MSGVYLHVTSHVLEGLGVEWVSSVLDTSVCELHELGGEARLPRGLS